MSARSFTFGLLRPAVEVVVVIRGLVARGRGDGADPAVHRVLTRFRSLGLGRPSVGVPEVCPLGGHHGQTEVERNPFALDNPPAGAMICSEMGGGSSGLCLAGLMLCLSGSDTGHYVNKGPH